MRTVARKRQTCRGGGIDPWSARPVETAGARMSSVEGRVAWSVDVWSVVEPESESEASPKSA